MPPTGVPPIFWVVCSVMFGAILGSYVNMAAYRLPRGISTVTRSRSFCPKCDHQLAWYDNIPILSYLILLGKCHYCRAPIPIRYLLTEIITAALFGLAAYQFFVLNPLMIMGPGGRNMPTALFIVQLFLIVDLILLSVVDLEVWLIPIETTLPWIAIGLVLAPIFPELHGSATTFFPSARVNALIDSFMGLVLGAGILWAIGFAVLVLSFYYNRIRGTGKRPVEGMGLGDVHLMGMVGAMLGWKPVVLALFLGVLIGCVVGISKMIWDEFQRWRLGEAWKPVQPVFDLPEQPHETPAKQQFWMLLLFGAIVLAVSAVLLWRSAGTFNGGMVLTYEEFNQGMPNYRSSWPFDFRAGFVYVMGFIGVLLVLATFFQNYLASIDMLPQGDIETDDAGCQKEVLQGNYIPFGPSLAAAAILVTFYSPLLRGLAFWWFVQNGIGPLPPMPYRMLGY